MDAYYQLVDRDTSTITVWWKALHITWFIIVVICGFTSAHALGRSIEAFGDNCILSANISLEAETVNTTKRPSMRYGLNDIPAHLAPINIASSTWGSVELCYFCQYTPLSSMIVGIIWGTFFIMGARGGAGYISDTVYRSWRIIYPAVTCALIATIALLLSTLKLQEGVKVFCAQFESVFHTKRCTTDIDQYSLSFFEEQRRVVIPLIIAIYCSYICFAAWVLQLATLILRILTSVDFQLIKITVLPVTKEEVQQVINPDNSKDTFLSITERGSKMYDETKVKVAPTSVSPNDNRDVSYIDESPTTEDKAAKTSSGYNGQQEKMPLSDVHKSAAATSPLVEKPKQKPTVKTVSNQSLPQTQNSPNPVQLLNNSLAPPKFDSNKISTYTKSQSFQDNTILDHTPLLSPETPSLEHSLSKSNSFPTISSKIVSNQLNLLQASPITEQISSHPRKSSNSELHLKQTTSILKTTSSNTLSNVQSESFHTNTIPEQAPSPLQSTSNTRQLLKISTSTPKTVQSKILSNVQFESFHTDTILEQNASHTQSISNSKQPLKTSTSIPNLVPSTIFSNVQSETFHTNNIPEHTSSYSESTSNPKQSLKESTSILKTVPSEILSNVPSESPHTNAIPEQTPSHSQKNSKSQRPVTKSSSIPKTVPSEIWSYVQSESVRANTNSEQHPFLTKKSLKHPLKKSTSNAKSVSSKTLLGKQSGTSYGSIVVEQDPSLTKKSSKHPSKKSTTTLKTIPTKMSSNIVSKSFDDISLSSSEQTSLLQQIRANLKQYFSKPPSASKGISSKMQAKDQSISAPSHNLPYQPALLAQENSPPKQPLNKSTPALEPTPSKIPANGPSTSSPSNTFPNQPSTPVQKTLDPKKPLTKSTSTPKTPK